MDGRRQDQHPTTEEADEFVVENLPRGPRLSRSLQSTGARVLLGTLAAVLVVTIVGTAFLALRDRRTPTTVSARTTTSIRPTATIQRTTPTPVRDPKGNGWTQVTSLAGDIKFSASSPQRGYLCGVDQNGHLTLGVTTDAGQTWTFGPVPAAYDACSIQISPTNALDVVVNSWQGDGCAAPCPLLDAHYSTDGGTTWQQAPIPPNTVAPGGAIWSGAYLYVWSGANKGSGQSGFLTVSANGSPFVSRDLNTLLPDAQNASIGSAVASGAQLYLNLTYSGCSSQDCWAIVASGDGGHTWTQVPNQPNIQLMYVVGNTLYAQQVEGTTTTLVLSRDGGASWTTLPLPPLPGGQPLHLSAQGSWVPAPNGTIFATSTDVGEVAYLRAGAWTVLPFEAYPDDTVAAVSLDANGQPQRIWGVIDPQDALRGIYWHALT